MIFGLHCSFTVILFVRLVLFTVARYLISGLMSMAFCFISLSNVCKNGQDYAKHRKTMSSYKSTIHKDMILIIQLRWVYFSVDYTIKFYLVLLYLLHSLPLSDHSKRCLCKWRVFNRKDDHSKNKSVKHKDALLFLIRCIRRRTICSNSKVVTSVLIIIFILTFTVFILFF